MHVKLEYCDINHYIGQRLQTWGMIYVQQTTHQQRWSAREPWFCLWHQDSIPLASQEALGYLARWILVDLRWSKSRLTPCSCKWSYNVKQPQKPTSLPFWKGSLNFSKSSFWVPILRHFPLVQLLKIDALGPVQTQKKTVDLVKVKNLASLHRNLNTPRKTNMSHENQWLEDVFSNWNSLGCRFFTYCEPAFGCFRNQPSRCHVSPTQRRRQLHWHSRMKNET